MSREPKAPNQRLVYYHFTEPKALRWLAQHDQVFTIDQLDELGLIDPAGAFITYRPVPKPGSTKKAPNGDSTGSHEGV